MNDISGAKIIIRMNFQDKRILPSTPRLPHVDRATNYCHICANATLLENLYVCKWTLSWPKSVEKTLMARHMTSPGQQLWHWQYYVTTLNISRWYFNRDCARRKNYISKTSIWLALSIDTSYLIMTGEFCLSQVIYKKNSRDTSRAHCKRWGCFAIGGSVSR